MTLYYKGSEVIDIELKGASPDGTMICKITTVEYNPEETVNFLSYYVSKVPATEIYFE